MIIPPFLKPGDRIGIVAPARKVSHEEMKSALETISKWGFEPLEGKNLYKADNQFSGSDKERADDINTFLADSSVKAILSARGGYGCMRIVDMIDWSLMLKNPKWLAGYSDITVFHNHLYNKGIASIHGTMPINFHKDPEATETLQNILKGNLPDYTLDKHDLNKEGRAKGKLIGGNLSLMYALQGSSTFPETKGNILFLEDLDEYLYHIDRMMISLKRSGALKDLAGMIIGGMSDMKDNTIPFGHTAEEIIYNAVKEYDYPVTFNFPAGHIDRNLPIIIGAEAELVVTEHESSLRYILPS